MQHHAARSQKDTPVSAVSSLTTVQIPYRRITTYVTAHRPQFSQTMPQDRPPLQRSASQPNRFRFQLHHTMGGSVKNDHISCAAPSPGHRAS
ncbi:hypothetical protein Cob_v011549 [Colletotrichum orbiculare MAFF 240422]|uniref:Uncharacterized protein n=1 Tax=Colletotrichum orbiculare (strain 104-T / ATCC 96160 / CBS 514.97 / LARS 414 / MAFF 240422) TaxID=1213857 RepID=A0A484FC09_COLOR|nr:hypothetical protein Cob_v011549 [Colletotrichum orbiculare MAFF 240422]